MSTARNIILGALLLTSSVLGTACPGNGTPLECDVCDAVFCDDNRVTTCVCTDADPDGGTEYSKQVLDDCAATAATCTVLVENQGQRWEDNFEPGDARCLDLCQSYGEPECRGEGDEAKWFLCAPATATTGALDDAVASWVETGAPGELPAADSAPLAWLDVGLACVDCDSTCGCDSESVCIGSYCLPGDEPESLVCCGRERYADCPDGAACEHVDGSAAVCDTLARCEPCESLADCETGVCYSAGEDVPAVCMSVADANERGLVACHDNGDEVWAADACGQLIVRVESCSDGDHCEQGECSADRPDIVVSPTLLNFGDTAVTMSAVRTLSIGNIGQTPLTVSEIVVDDEDAALFTVSAEDATVEVDEIVDVTVTFTPTAAGTVSGRLYIRSDDDDEAEVIVLMNGNGTP